MLYLQIICLSSQTSILYAKVHALADIVVGVEGFEPTQPEASDLQSDPTLQLWRTPLYNGINKTQTHSRSLNVSEYKDSAFLLHSKTQTR